MKHYLLIIMRTSTDTICKLSGDTPAFYVIEKIVRMLPDYHWLADITGVILAVSESAERIAQKGNKLPILSGQQIQICLCELLYDIPIDNAGRGDKSENDNDNDADDSNDIKLFGLELEIEGGMKLADLRISVLPATFEGKRLFFVSLNPYEMAQEQVDRTSNNRRLDGMTDLAARIAHEINNPLDGSIRFINLALRRLTNDINEASPEKLTEYLSSARNALGKINDILADLSQFAKAGQAKIENISINELITQAIQTFSARLKSENINVITMLSDELPICGGTKLYQVFCNLLKNAIDAIIEKRRKDSACNSVITITSNRIGERVEIIFEDTGIGLPDEKERRYLFDPFYTTKPPEQGMGLGLAISREIIEQYGGKIIAENRSSGGARFVITLKAICNDKSDVDK